MSCSECGNPGPATGCGGDSGYEGPCHTPARRIRVRSENGERMAAALEAAGYFARWLGAGTAGHTVAGGCTDPGHCDQHESYYDPQRWGSIETTASGSVAHRIWVEGGLVHA